jgi:hypothetical protein
MGEEMKSSLYKWPNGHKRLRYHALLARHPCLLAAGSFLFPSSIDDCAAPKPVAPIGHAGSILIRLERPTEMSLRRTQNNPAVTPLCTYRALGVRSFTLAPPANGVVLGFANRSDKGGVY